MSSIGYRILRRWVFPTDVSIAPLRRLVSGIAAEPENESTKRPKPRNDRNQRFTEILNGKTEIESNAVWPAQIQRLEIRWY